MLRSCRKVTVALVSHWPCVTDFVHLYAQKAYEAGDLYYTEFWTNFSTGPLVTATAPPLFCHFQLRSVTDEQHVRSHAQKELVGEIISAGRQ